MIWSSPQPQISTNTIFLVHNLSRLYRTHPINIQKYGGKSDSKFFLINGLTTFSSKNLKQAFPVAVDQSHTTSQMNFEPFEPFFLTELLKIKHILRMSFVNSSFHIIPQHFYMAEVWALTGPPQKADFVYLKQFCRRFTLSFLLLHYPAFAYEYQIVTIDRECF